MTTDEKFVRENWEYVELCFHPIVWWVIVGGDFGSRYALKNRGSDTEAWSEAAEFTRERLEEIRQVEREISELLAFCGTEEDWVKWCVDGPYVPNKEVSALIRNYITRSRVLAARKEALSELRKGMK